MIQSTLYRKVASRLSGYDIFISYRHKDAEEYAKKIHAILESKGLIVFRDESEADNPGTSTEKFAKLACSARCLVTIVTPDVFKSTSVYEELSSYFNNRIDKWYRRPFSRIISINVDQSLSKVPKEPPNWQRLANYVYETESIEAVINANPSNEVISRLTGASSFMNAWRRFLILIGLLILGAIGAIGLTSSYLNGLRKNISEKENELQLINDSTEKLSNRNSKLETDFKTLFNISESLRNDSMTLATSNINLKFQTSQLDSSNGVLRKERETLIEKSAFLRRQADSLDAKTVMLNYRIAALNVLETDPVKAYRLAEQAYYREQSAENRQILLAALSSIDYYYKSVVNDYRILDFKDPFILLTNKEARDSIPNLAIYDMKSYSLKNVPIHADHAWIIPNRSSWRILTRSWNGQGARAIAEYQLWDDSFEPIGTKIQEGGLTMVQFLNPHTVSITLNRQPTILKWDLLSNKKEYIIGDSTESLGTAAHYYEIYGSLDTRSDGISAGHYANGLVLIDANGKIDTSSYTEVDFDPSSFFSRAKWSPDGKYLALNYFDRKRLGIWNPIKKSFVWLDPDGWVVNSFSWSQNGHLLAFSGRTENDIDVIVEFVDASTPEKSRRIVYRGEIPIQSIAFLRGDENIVICDKESNMSIVDLATARIVGKGQQSDLVKSSPLGFYSSSVEDFKSWHTSPAPSKNWFFKSDSVKRYFPKGTVHPSNRWIAVPYFRKVDTTSGIEIRNTISNERKNFSIPYDFRLVIRFAKDGNWLILCNSKTLYFWNTNSWNQFSIEVDRTFEEFNAEKNIIYASFDSAEHRVTYKYDLNGQKPKFVGRDPRVIKIKTDNIEEESLSDEIEKSINGWKLDKLYKYRTAWWERSGPWAIRLTCRDQALGAQDCDVLFVPTDLTWLMKVYDKLLWKPKKEELLSLIKN